MRLFPAFLQRQLDRIGFGLDARQRARLRILRRQSGLSAAAAAAELFRLQRQAGPASAAALAHCMRVAAAAIPSREAGRRVSHTTMTRSWNSAQTV